MSESRAKFNEYILNKYPNRSPKILLQLKRINHSDYVYEVQGVQDLWELWQHQQAKIEQLKVKNEKTQKQFNFLLDKNIRDESAHATLKLKFMEVSCLVRSLRNEFDLNDDCQQTDRQIELLEELLRGEHE